MQNDGIGSFYTDGGSVECVGANRPFLLTGCGASWLVLEGGVEIFSVALAEGEPAGRRTNLFRVAVGDVIVGSLPAGQVTRGLPRGG